MKVAIKCGETEVEFFVPDNLLYHGSLVPVDALQDYTMHRVGDHFVEAYRKEIERATLSAQ